MTFKNIFAAGLAAAALGAGLVSCSDDTLGDLTKGDGTVTFSTVIEDETATRAMGDGLSATQLRYAVYDDNGNYVTDGSATMSNRQASVTLQLTSGMSYDIVFFALRNTSVYDFDAQNHKVTVNYAQMAGGSSSSYFRYDDDCFYQVRKGYKAGSSTQEDVILYRPMAQVNFGSDDLDAEVVKNKYGSYVYSGIATTACTMLDLLSGEASDEEEIVLPYKRPVDAGLGDFPVAGYTYLTSAYILVTEPSPLRDITMNAADSRSASAPIQTVSVPHAPTKRNYRTNIYGSLLTSSSDWNVVIEPIFEGSTDIWNGSAEDPRKVSDTEYAIDTPAQLAGLARMVNAGTDFAGITVKLNTDIDLGNRNWTPIGTFDKPFNGIFDGQDHVISNLNITLGTTSVPAGLFGAIKSNGSNKGELRNLVIDGAKVNTLAASPAKFATGVALGQIYTGRCVENVTVKNATVDAYRWAGGVVGKGYGSVNYCTAENVEVNAHFEQLGTEWDNADKAGAIMGQQDEGKYTLIGNKAMNVKVTGYRHIGGLFGHVNYGEAANPKTVSDNSINGGTVSQNMAHPYSDVVPGTQMGEISGYFGSYINQSNNTAAGVELIKPSTVTDLATLQAAVATGGFVKLSTDLDLSAEDGTVNITAPTTLNLNGHKLTVKGNALNVESELTIDGDGELTSKGNTLIGASGSKIIINNGVVSSTATGKYNYAINTNGDLEMNGGEVTNVAGTGLMLNWANEFDTAHRAVVTGGTVTAGNEYAFNVNGGSGNVKHQVAISGGTFLGNSGARADGNVKVVINGGDFIQKSTNSYGHAFCAGAETNYSGTEVTINGGYFYGGPGYAICNAGQATTIVNGAFINKTGGGFSLGAGRSTEQLASPATRTILGDTYTFDYQVK